MHIGFIAEDTKVYQVKCKVSFHLIPQQFPFLALLPVIS